MPTPTTTDRDTLRAWLVERVAFYLDRPAENIDPTMELAHYGVDSVYAISIVSDIEEHLRVKVDTGEASRLGTVNDLTDYLLHLPA